MVRDWQPFNHLHSPLNLSKNLLYHVILPRKATDNQMNRNIQDSACDQKSVISNYQTFERALGKVSGG